MQNNKNRNLIGAVILLSVLGMSGLTFANSASSTLNANSGGLVSVNSAGWCPPNAVCAPLGDNLSAWKARAQARIDTYNNDLNTAQSSATAYASNGVNIANVDLLISNARSQIVDPLQQTVNTATNVSQVKTALGEYCLYNGCTPASTVSAPAAINYHFGANFQIDLLNDRVAALQGTNLDLSPVIADINNASSILTTVGASKYQGTQDAQVWSNIHNAKRNLKQLLRYASPVQ